MAIIAKISKGTLMDQIYIPKNRIGFDVGSYVRISPAVAEPIERFFFHNIRSLEKLKLKVIDDVFSEIEKIVVVYDNIIVTGSFLEKGFNFEDIDIIVLTDKKINSAIVELELSKKTGIKPHLIFLSNKEFLKGVTNIPAYEMMLAKCITKRRLVYRIERKLDHRILDLELLKSENLPLNFDSLNGKEKYNLTRNLIAISLFMKNEKLTKEAVDGEISRIFKIKPDTIKANMLQKKSFSEIFRKIYRKTYNEVLNLIPNGSKQKKAS